MASDFADNSLTHGAGNLLTKKYAGLPFGIWLVLVGGTAYFVHKYISNANSTAATVDSSNPAVNTDTVTPSAASNASGFTGGSLDSASPANNLTQPVATPAAATTPAGDARKVSSLQIQSSAVTGILTPTLYAYWVDSAGKNVSGTLELQEYESNAWVDIATIPVANGIGSHQVKLAKGHTYSFRVQIPANNSSYKQQTSSPLALKN